MEAGGRVAEAMIAFRTFVGESDMLAYLATMAPRLVELRRVLKDTGSLSLHCDPTASHYLKLLLNAVFEPSSFRSEIVWKRSSAHSDAKQGRKMHGHIHDVLLFHTKGDIWTWNTQYTPYDQEYIDRDYRQVDGSREHTCAVTTTNWAFCRGHEGPEGRLGDGRAEESRVPRAVLGDLRFERVTTGAFHTCAETTTKRAYCLGRGFDGQLGNGTAVTSETPSPVSGPS